MGCTQLSNATAMQCIAALFIAFSHIETYAPEKWEAQCSNQ